MSTHKPSTAKAAAAYLIAATAGIGLLTFLPASVTTTSHAVEPKPVSAPVHTASAPVPVGATCEESVAASLAWYTGPITDDTVSVLHGACAELGDVQAVIFEDGSWVVRTPDGVVRWRGCTSVEADCAD